MDEGEDTQAEPLEYARMKEIRPLPAGDSPHVMRWATIVLCAAVLAPFLLGIIVLLGILIFL
ncbi:MAG: hypothetical protein IPK83_07620 [Planctomycetes bacterium]|nr:hypothetical protein [Planctomycetota bacterium]